MYLLTEVGKTGIGIPMNMVGKVIEASKIEHCGEDHCYEGDPVNLLSGGDILGIRMKGERVNASGIKLNLSGREDTILMVDTVAGFMDAKDSRIYSKPDFLNHYGFGLVSSFAVVGERLYHLIDTAQFERRIMETGRAC